MNSLLWSFSIIISPLTQPPLLQRLPAGLFDVAPKLITSVAFSAGELSIKMIHVYLEVNKAYDHTSGVECWLLGL
ncbi:hypothetical protein B0J12DRAFT_669408 [Macrophomina phaseolina]|uniref:Uncharacterized protein n=1 Tax=Macrophomina phaseolina TaxID=35725 RepID=A0ABQ8G953_9PEZI|nr:hypothetical protein B0J12DRAFT_669408 [Macrophomina phaseolina]